MLTSCNPKYAQKARLWLLQEYRESGKLKEKDKNLKRAQKVAKENNRKLSKTKKKVC